MATTWHAEHQRSASCWPLAASACGLHEKYRCETKDRDPYHDIELVHFTVPHTVKPTILTAFLPPVQCHNRSG
jgi:hypothetical protein